MIADPKDVEGIPFVPIPEVAGVLPTGSGGQIDMESIHQADTTSRDIPPLLKCVTDL